MRKKSLSEQVEDTVYNMIAAGDRFHLGDKLPNENDLSRELGVSRATLREAIRSLVVQGVLEVTRGKGTYIVGDLRMGGDEGFKNIERMRVRLRELYEMRLVVEPETTRMAAKRATEQELEQILSLGQHEAELLRANSDPREDAQVFKDWIATDRAFHEAIVMASHNSFLGHLVPMINRSISEAILLAEDREAQCRYTLQDHLLIMEFLAARDHEGAKFAMAMHIHHAMSALKFEL